jgi:hypothetical protein
VSATMADDRVCGGESSTSGVFAFMVCHLSAGVHENKGQVVSGE